MMMPNLLADPDALVEEEIMETNKVVRILPEEINLKADNDKYLSVIARGAGNSVRAIEALKDHPDDWCNFKVLKEDGSGNRYRFKAADGRWLGIFNRDGRKMLEANSDSFYDDHCWFEVMFIDDSKIAVRPVSTEGKGMYWQRIYYPGGGYAGTIQPIQVQQAWIGLENQFTVSLAAVGAVSIENVKYDLEHATKHEPIAMIGTTHNISNPSSATISQNISYSIKEYSEATWNNALGVEVGISAKFKVGVPGIVDIETGITVTSEYTHEWGGTTGNERVVTHSTNVEVPPHRNVKAKIVYWQCELDVPFTYDQVWTDITGTIQKVSKRGIYNGLSGYGAEVKTDKVK